MKNLTPLLPTDLFAIEIPEDAVNFTIENDCYSILHWDTSDILGGSYLNFPETNNNNWEILGTVFKDEIGFDAEPYCWNEDVSIGRIWIDYRLYNGVDEKNIIQYKEKRPYKFDTPQESFYSLLESNGLYFTNPLGDAPILQQYEDIMDFKNDDSKWQQAEDNLCKKLLILKKI